MLSKRSATNIDATDTVILFPSFGHLARRGRAWRIPITGMVFEQGSTCERKLRWLKLLQRLHRFHPQDDERPLFDQRVHAFVAPTQRGKRLAVRAGNEIYPLANKTSRTGLLSTSLHLATAVVEALEPAGGWLSLEVVRPEGHDTGYRGMVQLLTPTGLSVVSDIDDTVRMTHVLCRRSLLESTFLREFETVDGISDVYQQWARQGAAFHYVSSSPWQLYPPLAQMFQDAGLPQGTFHLSAFRLRDHMLRRFWMLRKRAKIAVLNALIATFPDRRFVLVGDSGERDPEIYAKLARQFGSQIVRIFIRDIPQRPMTATRCEKVFAGIDPRCWRVFQHSAELPACIEA
jgi:hypothetical protein